MSGWRLLALTTASTVLLAAGLCAQPALADGDPASDVLLSQNVFLPEGQTTPATLVSRLDALTRAADRAGGRPIKVALIAAPTDLGSVTALWGQPTKYARFLSLELEFVTRAPVLIVMPQGIGYARAGKTIPPRRLTGLTVGIGPAGLAETAITSINRLDPHLKPAPVPKPRQRVQLPPPPARHVQPPPQAAPANPGASAAAGPRGSSSDSLPEVIASRFETGAEKPVVWLALGIAIAFVGLGIVGVYLLSDGAARRGPRR